MSIDSYCSSITSTLLQGHTLAYRKYSTAYIWAEDAAKAERLGIWAGEFVPPWIGGVARGFRSRTLVMEIGDLISLRT